MLDSSNLTSKSNLIYRPWHDLIQFFVHLVVAYSFLGHPVYAFYTEKGDFWQKFWANIGGGRPAPPLSPFESATAYVINQSIEKIFTACLQNIDGGA